MRSSTRHHKKIPKLEPYSNPKVVLKNSPKKGRGVFALRAIRKGEVIGVFDGEVYDAEFEDWTPNILNYVIQIGHDLWRDSTGLAKYLNHSCEPNCGFRGRFKVVAMRDIEVGEELTWDYEMSEMNNYGWRMRCRCGASSCRGEIGHHRNMPRSIRERYGSHISYWIRKRK